jgi:hypothetical protein
MDIQVEYVIIDKKAIENRIEEFQKYIIQQKRYMELEGGFDYGNQLIKIKESQIELLKEILSQSTPLIPEIENGNK